MAVLILVLSVYVTRNWRRCQKTLSQTEQLRIKIEERNRLLSYHRLVIDEYDSRSKLGEGAFGVVYKGFLLSESRGLERKKDPENFELGVGAGPGGAIEVACKTIPVSDAHTDMLEEVEVMLGIEAHPNVLGLKGLYIPKTKIINQLKKDGEKDSCFTRSIVVMERMKTSLDKYRVVLDRCF